MIIDSKLSDKMQTVTDRLVINNGRSAQVLKASEEMSELSAALCKFLNDQCGIAEVVDEIADALFMVHQLSSFFGERAVLTALDMKLGRTVDRFLTERALQEKEHGGIYSTEHDPKNCDICRRVAGGFINV